MIASSAGRVQIVYDLLGHDAQVNAVNNNGQSSLHYAASKGHLQVICLHSSEHLTKKKKYLNA